MLCFFRFEGPPKNVQNVVARTRVRGSAVGGQRLRGDATLRWVRRPTALLRLLAGNDPAVAAAASGVGDAAEAGVGTTSADSAAIRSAGRLTLHGRHRVY